MSLMKWTLAMAGTALGLRYMSDRHRRRAGSDSSSRINRKDTDSMLRAPQIDRDADSGPWAPQDAGSASMGSSSAGTGTGAAGATPGAGSVDRDDLLAADSDLAPGSSSNRF